MEGGHSLETPSLNFITGLLKGTVELPLTGICCNRDITGTGRCSDRETGLVTSAENLLLHLTVPFLPVSWQPQSLLRSPPSRQLSTPVTVRGCEYIPGTELRALAHLVPAAVVRVVHETRPSQAALECPGEVHVPLIGVRALQHEDSG